MQSLPPSDLDHRGHHLRLHQAAPEVWFQAIYLMTQDKKGISAMKLHRHLGISYNAAWRIRHKLMQVMMERDREHPLGGWIELDDAYLGGQRSGGKRGRGAPGKTPFVAAVETNEEGHPLRMKLTVVEGFRLSEIAAWAQQHLGAGTRVVSDGLACFHGVTEAGCVHEPVVVGGGANRMVGAAQGILDILRSSSIGSTPASTCPTSSLDWSMWRSERPRCPKGCSSYA